jgi:hypothetical protein
MRTKNESHAAINGSSPGRALCQGLALPIDAPEGAEEKEGCLFSLHFTMLRRLLDQESTQDTSG